ncbi:diguanylate cyclase [Synechococcus sp. RSCCF101]|uniref:sensor domain-containing diguanylate cyclase n=1 Tax=Synechococcus sp. RSCCF101 TaxID=2511069 RepID=UPI0012471661|nr:diguanylate cyclase [Synechococcus sp. RSCCF101]QEY32671.1 diguanylate cyclase [Synechococcus sp. RSCCF101]
MRVSIKKAVVTLWALVVAGQSLLALTLVSVNREQRLSRERVTLTHERITRATALIGHLKDLETGQRGFLLTGRDYYLEPYSAALQVIRQDLDQLAALIEDFSLTQALRLRRIAELSEQKIAELDETIDLVQAGDQAAALAIVNSDRGKLIMDRIRDQTRYLIAWERARLRERDAQLAAVEQRALLLALGLMALNAALIGAFLLLMSRVVAGPITELERAMQRFRQTGQAARPKPAVHGITEVQALTTSFYAMCVTIGEQASGLVRANRSLEATVADRTRDLAKRNSDLAQRSQQLQQTLADTDAGIWSLDIPTSQVHGDATTQRLIGMAAGAEHLEHWRTIVHPDDQKELESAVQQALISQASLLTTAFRVVSDRGVRTLKLDAHLLHGDGMLTQVQGLIQDITDYALSRERLLRARERYQRLIENLGGQYLVFSEEPESGRLLYVSAGSESFFGCSLGSADPVDLTEAVDWRSGAAEQMRQVRRTLLEESASEETHEYAFAHPDSGERFVRVTSHLSRDDQAFPLIEGVIEDITSSKQEAQALQYVARHDGLTDLFNRAAISALLEQEFARARRYGRYLALLMLDLDHFKRINDGHGHPVGDAVLIRFAREVLRSIRATDQAGRYGGEEFLVLLPEAGPGEAERFAERIRAAIEAMVVRPEAEAIRVTVSVGYSVLSASVRSPEELLSQADQALYSAKATGRNRVCGWGTRSAGGARGGDGGPPLSG